ncbi:energy-coupling factor transporter transmembrane component T family protein [Cellulomonas composti]|uniref:Cobalt ABC transporter n=1 Tax=Cellulomonas composti TaxID=266130 RepID=A0A511J5W8_9CELL|nr:energy-coupling factor transporter transmembrane protein EcfT [Cellulomonas composti]GEL93371.1 hypothetical protein CCO02nite_00290 [Cellulomonas composti]
MTPTPDGPEATGRPLRAPWSGPLGLYRPGTSPVHRAPGGAKLVALLVVTTLGVVLQGVPSALVLLALVLLAYAVARVPLRGSAGGLTATLLGIGVLAVFRWWSDGPAGAIELTADLLAAVLLAALVTATTRSDVLLDTLARAARPLRHVGLAPEQVSLAIALMLRTVPVLVVSTVESRDAARARGLGRDPRAVVVPAAVRMVGHAHRVGEALAARGLGEPDGPTPPRAADSHPLRSGA